MANIVLRSLGVLLGLTAAGARIASASEGEASQATSDQVVLCESQGYRKVWCSSTRPIEQVVLERVVSNSACIQGTSWGFDQTGVWVDHGCRAYFRLIAGHPETTLVNIPCASNNYQPAQCDTGLNILSARVASVQSRAPCTEGQTWSAQGRTLSVSNGCRATFTIAGTRP